MKTHTSFRIKLFILFVLLTAPCLLYAQRAPEIVWQKCFGGSSREDEQNNWAGHKCIVQTSDGGYAFVARTLSTDGDLSGVDSIDNNGTSIWVVKFNESRAIEWEIRLADTNGEWLSTSIIQTSDKGFVITGYVFGSFLAGYHVGNWDGYVAKLDSTGNLEWQKFIGGTANDIITSAIETKSGEYVLVGFTNSNDEGFSIHGKYDSLLSGYPEDAYIVKLNSSGDLLWQRCYGGSSLEQGASIIESSDGGYVFLSSTYSLDGDLLGIRDSTSGGEWVVKLDTTGTIQWQKCLGGTGKQGGFSIINTSDKGYAICGIVGYYDKFISGYHGGGSDAWVAKLDSIGNVQWQKCYGGSFNDYAFSIIQSADGGYAFTGYTNSNDGDVSGYHPSLDSLRRFNDVWVVKLNKDGGLKWQKCLGSNGEDMGFSIIQLKDGEYVVCAEADSNNADVSGCHGGQDIWIVKLFPFDEGVEESHLQDNSVPIYPNPSSDQIHLQLCETQSIRQITFYDVMGRELKAQYHLEGSEGTADVRSLPDGAYIARVEYSDKDITIPFIVRH